jgi:hypothetical protein
MATDKLVRVRLFSEEYPEGKLFTTMAAVDQAMAEGWVDAKHKVEEIKPKVLANYITEMPPPPKGEPLGENLCACGCGTPTMKTYAPGHYAKHQKKIRGANGYGKDDKPPDNSDFK